MFPRATKLVAYILDTVMFGIGFAKQVPLGFLLVWQLGRLLLLVAMIVTEFMRRRDEDQYETLFLTQRDVSIAGVVFLDLCIFGSLMSILIANGLTIYHEQKAQSIMLREKGVHMLEQVLPIEFCISIAHLAFQRYWPTDPMLNKSFVC